MQEQEAINKYLVDASRPFHLGDGAYAHFDGYSIWLTTQTGDRIALEPSVFDALLAYRADLKKKFVDAGSLPPGKGCLG